MRLGALLKRDFRFEFVESVVGRAVKFDHKLLSRHERVGRNKALIRTNRIPADRALQLDKNPSD